MLKKNDYYATLQVHPKAMDVVITKAYRELCKLYHPDAGGSVDQMSRLNEAYEVLSNPEKRRDYDMQSGRLPLMSWGRPKQPPAPAKGAPRRPDVGLPWWDPAHPNRPLAWVKEPLETKRNYPFERSRVPWERSFDRRHGRVVECATCQGRVLLVFQPESSGWNRAIGAVDELHCRQCQHHMACYECPHAESRMALEVRMQVIGGCVPLTSLWMAVR